MNGKRQMWFQFIKRVISKCLETKDLFHYFQYVNKIFERLIYNNLFEFFIKNKLIPFNESGFKQGDSCLYQFLSIAHEIYQ